MELKILPECCPSHGVGINEFSRNSVLNAFK